MGYPTVLQEGPSELGADLVVTVGSDLLPRQFTVGVQVFAYEGEVSTEELNRKLLQLEEGWGDNELDYGVLLTTGSCGSAGADLVAQHNRDNPKHLVLLLDGKQVSRLFLEHFDVTTANT
jgi:hypothetical protein